MRRGTGVTVVGADLLHQRLSTLKARYETPMAAAPAILTQFEIAEVGIFNRLHGRFVKTGATRDSLIGVSGKSLRKIEGDRITFGTNVWYAVFLRKLPVVKAPAGGKTLRGGRSSSAVLLSRAAAMYRARKVLKTHLWGVRS